MSCNIPQSIPIGHNWGEFKIEHEQTDCLIYGRKTYRIGDHIKVSGFKKRYATKEEFDTGQIKDNQQITINTTKDFNTIGTFIETTRDLKEQLQNHIHIQEKYDEVQLYCDLDIKDLNYFLERELVTL